MAIKAATLLTAVAFTYLLAPLIVSSETQTSYPISLVVYNSLNPNQKNLTYNTNIAYRGILLGAMRRIQSCNNNFSFTTTDNPDYGPFLVSVNGLAGNVSKQTYWELLFKPQNGNVTRSNVGVGCLIPNPNDTVILKFTKW